MKPVGIDKIRVWPGSLALPMDELCKARGRSVDEARDTLMVDERSVNPPWEDPVTMAVNAADAMLTDEERASIRLLLVCSESGVDQEKPLSVWVHKWLELDSRCRNLEVKHACYSGTGAVHLASAMVGASGGRALVISTDQSRMHFGKPWELVMGACATAVLVSQEPRLLEIEMGKSGVYTREVMDDLCRPTSRVEQGNSETSLLSYLEALDSAVPAYIESVGERIDYDYFKKNIYHVPFGGMTLRATRRALEHFGGSTKARAQALWEEKTKPSLRFTRRMGGTYASSTFIAMLGMIASCNDLQPRDRIGVFAYGSGCCSEMYSGLLGPQFREMAAEAKLGELLDMRKRITVREYEECERERVAWIDSGDFEPSTDGLGDHYARRYGGRRLLTFRGAKDFYRRYERS
jgi:3-hydroxy-3-methylglutaryl CoA synthase